MRIAWFSTLEPFSKDGRLISSSYFSKLLLPEILRAHELEIFNDEDHADKNQFKSPQRNVSVHNYLTAFQRHKEKPFDLFFYQIEDKKELNFSRMHLGLIPGIVLFHDALFTTKLPDALSLSNWQKTIAELTANPSILNDYDGNFDSPFSIREANLALASLYTNRWQMSEINRIVKSGLQKNLNIKNESRYLPTPIDKNILIKEKNCTESLIEDKKFKIAFSGTTQIEDRIFKLLQALKIINSEIELNWMLPFSEIERAKEILKEEGYNNYKIYSGNSIEVWNQVLECSDIAVHLRRSVFGDLKIFYQYSKFVGLPIILTNFQDAMYESSEGTISIDAGLSEVMQLKEAIISFIEYIKINNTKLKFSREHFTPKNVADELCFFFEENFEFVYKFNKEIWKKIEDTAASKINENIYKNFGPVLMNKLS